MGGAYISLSFNEFDEVIKETIFQIISEEKYSFSDKKTLSLINMVNKVAKTDVTVFHSWANWDRKRSYFKSYSYKI